jgi:hypothetical protein
MPMRPDLSVKRTPATNGKLHLFSLSVDFPASVRVRWVANVITKLAGPRWSISSEMWKTDSLATNQRIQQMTIEDATNADVIIIALSSLTQRDPTLTQWLDSLAAGKHNRPLPGLFIGLIGDAETEVAELKWLVKPMICCAQQLGRDFIWQWMGTNAANDSDWLSDHIQHLLARTMAIPIEKTAFCAR